MYVIYIKLHAFVKTTELCQTGATHIVDDSLDQVVLAFQRRVQQQSQRVELDPHVVVDPLRADFTEDRLLTLRWKKQQRERKEVFDKSSRWSEHTSCTWCYWTWGFDGNRRLILFLRDFIDWTRLHSLPQLLWYFFTFLIYLLIYF